MSTLQELLITWRRSSIKGFMYPWTKTFRLNLRANMLQQDHKTLKCESEEKNKEMQNSLDNEFSDLAETNKQKIVKITTTAGHAGFHLPSQTRSSRAGTSMEKPSQPPT